MAAADGDTDTRLPPDIVSCLCLACMSANADYVPCERERPAWSRPHRSAPRGFALRPGLVAILRTSPKPPASTGQSSGYASWLRGCPLRAREPRRRRVRPGRGQVAPGQPPLVAGAGLGPGWQRPRAAARTLTTRPCIRSARCRIMMTRRWCSIAVQDKTNEATSVESRLNGGTSAKAWSPAMRCSRRAKPRPLSCRTSKVPICPCERTINPRCTGTCKTCTWRLSPEDHATLDKDHG